MMYFYQGPMTPELWLRKDCVYYFDLSHIFQDGSEKFVWVDTVNKVSVLNRLITHYKEKIGCYYAKDFLPISDCIKDFENL